MSAAWATPEIRYDPETRTAHADFEIRNDSAEPWRAADGFAIGYHVFDAETGTLIVDGPRIPADLKPGESKRLQFDIPFPPEQGRYQAFVSAMREHVCWYYEQGWPFLLIEVSSALDRVRVATAGALGREHAFRAIRRALVYPFRTIWQNRGLIHVMVRRDILGRYRGSFGGAFWTLINPLLLMLTYLFVFGYVLKSRFPNDNSPAGFALYFLAGMLPWLAFSEAAGRAPSVMLEHRNFVKKLVFAVETLPVNLVVSGLVSELFAIVLFCVFLLFARGEVPLSVLWLPLILIPQVLFTAGVSWFLAALGVFIRDLGQIIGFLLTIWFFITPICYPEEQFKAAAPILSKNPVYVLVRAYRAIFLEHHPPAFGPLWKFWVLSAIIFILGHAWFYKLRKSFPDLI